MLPDCTSDRSNCLLVAVCYSYLQQEEFIALFQCGFRIQVLFSFFTFGALLTVKNPRSLMALLMVCPSSFTEFSISTKKTYLYLISAWLPPPEFVLLWLHNYYSSLLLPLVQNCAFRRPLSFIFTAIITGTVSTSPVFWGQNWSHLLFSKYYWAQCFNNGFLC